MERVLSSTLYLGASNTIINVGSKIDILAVDFKERIVYFEYNEKKYEANIISIFNPFTKEEV